MSKKNKAQSTLEYAVLIAVVVGALVAIQVYFKRGVQGKLRDSADQIGEQYSAGKMSSTVKTNQTGNIVTRESFGTSDVGGQGISKYEVITGTTAQTKRQVESENLNVNLTGENLIE